MSVKIRYHFVAGYHEANVTEDADYNVLSFVSPSSGASHCVIVDDNGALYMTKNAVAVSDSATSSGSWTLTYASVPAETIIFPTA
jgi:hypothetical protein